MITEEGGKGLRRPHCTVEEVSLSGPVSFENYFMNFWGVSNVCTVVQNLKGIKGCTVTINFTISLLYLAPPPCLTLKLVCILLEIFYIYVI